MKLDVAIESFINYISTERRFSALTATAYSEDLRHFADFLFSHYKIDEVEGVSHLEIRDWQMAMSAEGCHPNTIRRRLATLRSWFKFLRRQKWVQTDVMAKVVSPKVPKRLPVFYGEKETERIYDSSNFTEDFEGFRDQLFLRLLYETGMRRAEVLTLTESSVDFGAGTIKVRGKRDKERIIPIENELSHTIKCYFSLKKEIEGCSDAFFVRSNGLPFKQYDVNKVVKKYMTEFSSADKISPHVFRHSFATHLLNDGADIEAIKELLGHSDLAATEVYTHVTREHMKEAYRHAHPRAKKGKK